MGESAKRPNALPDPADLSESEVRVSSLTDSEQAVLQPTVQTTQAPATLPLDSDAQGKPRIVLHRRGLSVGGTEENQADWERTWLTIDSVPGYLIQGLLGRGGMGEVFLAKHVRLQREVALKILARPSSLTRRFEREMALAGKLQHPNIVKTYDAGCLDQFSYLAMEHIQGCNLAQLVVSRGPLPAEIVREILRQALRAMVHIHEMGIVHRDIKPANFMLSIDGCVKMLDLGLAKQDLVDEQGTTIQTVTQHLLGTAAYAAPEQGFDTRAVGPASDIYALGCLAYFLLTGKHPYEGATAVETFVMHRDSPVPDVLATRPDVEPGLASCIAEMMAKLPVDRPIAEDLLQKCEQYPEVSLIGTAIPTPVATLFADSDFQDTTALSLADKPIVEPVVEQRPRFARRWLAVYALLPVLIGVTSLLWPVTTWHIAKDSQREWSSITQASASEGGEVWHVLPPRHVELLKKHPELEVLLLQLPADVQATDGKLQALLERLRQTDATEERTTLIHCLPAFASLNTIVTCMRTSNSSDIRAACIQMLGVYQPGGPEVLAIFEKQKSALYEELTDLYVADPDPEVHSSLQWLATRWNWAKRWEALKPCLQQKAIPYAGGWYHPPVAPAMVVIPGPRDVELGSLFTPPGHDERLAQDERPRTVHMPRTFAISTIEVSRQLRWRVSSEHWHSAQPADGQLPVNAIQWFEAAKFCNELSRIEGLPESEFCYEIKRVGERIEFREVPDALERTGYRLPTDDEWEIACRAGSTSIRPFGDDPGWMSEYAHCLQSDQEFQQLRPAGTCKPNQFGLFDMLGNISEWTNDLIYIEEERRRRLRGGSVWTDHSGLRSAARYYIAERLLKPHERTGFRVARTLRPQPLSLPNGLNLYVEVPSWRALDPGHTPQQPTHEQVAIQHETTQAVASDGLPASPWKQGVHLIRVTHQQPVALGSWHAGNVPALQFHWVNTSSEEIRIVPEEQSNFAIEPPVATILQPGMSTQFSLRCIENFIGDRVSDIVFDLQGESQTPVQLKMQIPVCLEGARPVLEDLGDFRDGELSVDLGNIPLGSRFGREFRLSNVGNLETTARVIEVTGDCELTRNIAQSLLPGASDWFHITLLADHVGECTGRIKLHSSEGDGQSVEIKLRAFVVDNGCFKLPGYFQKGRWSLNHNGDGTTIERIRFGSPTDMPLTGDWNGDGHTDFAACHRNEEGHWHWSLLVRDPANSAGQESGERIEFVWGDAEERPVVADVNGDGRTDFGLVRAAESSRPEHYSEFVARFDVDGDRSFDTERTLRWDSSSTSLDELVVLSGDFDSDNVDELVLTRTPDLNSTTLRRWRIHYADGRLLKRNFGVNSHTPVIGDWNADGGDDLGTATEVAHSTVFYFNLDDDEYPEADIRYRGGHESSPIAALK